MRMAGELVSPARGLYTTANHPSLAHPTDDTPPVPNVPTVPASQSPPLANSPQSDVTPPLAVPVTDHTTGTIPPVPNVPTVPSVPSPQSPPLANSPERDVPAVPAIPVTDHATSTISTVPSVPNPAHSTSEVAQQQIDASPVPDAAYEASSSVGAREELSGEVALASLLDAT
jgi:hypothetical protein